LQLSHVIWHIQISHNQFVFYLIICV